MYKTYKTRILFKLLFILIVMLYLYVITLLANPSGKLLSNINITRYCIVILLFMFFLFLDVLIFLL